MGGIKRNRKQRIRRQYMLAKGNETTLRVVKNLFTAVKNRKQSFVGARFESNLLAEDIPITTLVQDTEINLKDNLFAGTILFRPVGKQVEILQAFRNVVDNTGLGQFDDESTEMPIATTTFSEDIQTADSVMSNIQEIPMRILMTNAEIYLVKTRLRGQTYTQVTLTEQAQGVTQSLILLFKTFEYDSETLLGTLSYGNGYTKTDMLKVLQFISNGSLIQQVVGGIVVNSQNTTTTVFPMFSDYTLSFLLEKEQPMLRIRSDNGVTSVPESALRRVEITKQTGFYTVTLHLAYNNSINITFG